MQQKINPNALFKQLLIKEDKLKVPEDAEFYNNLHERIMSGVEKAEIRKNSKWSQTWVFLEPGQIDLKSKSRINLTK